MDMNPFARINAWLDRIERDTHRRLTWIDLDMRETQ